MAVLEFLNGMPRGTASSADELLEFAKRRFRRTMKGVLVLLGVIAALFLFAVIIKYGVGAH